MVVMKYLLLSFLTVVFITMSLPTKAADIDNVCNYIAADDKNRIRKALKSAKLKLRKIFKSARCNGKNVLVFADERNAMNAGEFIISKLTKKQVSENIASLTALQAIANERVK